MKVINVYEQYFAAELEYNGVQRKGALTMLIATSDGGTIRYEAAVTFFPHRDEEDYSISYDACFSKELYSAPGRRSRKGEKLLLDDFRQEIDALAEEAGGSVLWSKPLREARWG